MESTEAKFISMIMDRLTCVELENDRLKMMITEQNIKLEQRCPSIYLTPYTKYTTFNDGWSFYWDLMKQPTILDEKNHNNMDVSDDDFVSLDDKHWNAVVFPCETFVQLDGWEDIPMSKRRLLLGHAGEPVTVRMMVEEINAHLQSLGDAVMCQGCNNCGEYRGFQLSSDNDCTDIILNVEHWLHLYIQFF